jgi:hypothetical protein
VNSTICNVTPSLAKIGATTFKMSAWGTGEQPIFKTPFLGSSPPQPVNKEPAAMAQTQRDKSERRFIMILSLRNKLPPNYESAQKKLHRLFVLEGR